MSGIKEHQFLYSAPAIVSVTASLRPKSYSFIHSFISTLLGVPRLITKIADADLWTAKCCRRRVEARWHVA